MNNSTTIEVEALQREQAEIMKQLVAMWDITELQLFSAWVNMELLKRQHRYLPTEKSDEVA